MNEKQIPAWCLRFHRCPLHGGGCQGEGVVSCQLLPFVAKQLSKFSEEVRRKLEEQNSFRYEEDWYMKLREEMVGKIISGKDLRETEDKAVDAFIKAGKKPAVL